MDVMTIPWLSIKPIFDEEYIANMCASAACERWQVINILVGAHVLERDPLHKPSNVVVGPSAWWAEKKRQHRRPRKPDTAQPSLFDGVA